MDLEQKENLANIQPYWPRAWSTIYTYNLNKNTRDWPPIVSYWKIFLWVSILFLFGKVCSIENLPQTHLMKRIHSKYSKQFHMKLRTLFNQIRTAIITCLCHRVTSLMILRPSCPFLTVFMMSHVYLVKPSQYLIQGPNHFHLNISWSWHHNFIENHTNGYM